MRERPGVYARRGDPRLGQARVLRPQSGRSGRRASTCGGRPESRGAGVRKKEPASSARIWGLPAEIHSICAGPSSCTASFRPGSRRRAAGPRAGPRGAQAQPVPRTTWIHSFFSSLIPTTHFHRGNPERPAVLPVVPSGITSDPQRRPQHPKLKEKRVPPPALVGGCPEVPNFSPNRGR